MKILIAAIHFPVASGRYIQMALKRLGHDVRTIGPYAGNAIWGIEVDPRWNWKPDFDTSDTDNVSLDIIAGLMADWGVPDLFIHADSSFCSPKMEITKHVLWGQDNHVRDYFPEDIKYDAMFLAHSWGERMTEPNAHWLPCCYDQKFHGDLGLERDLDAAMIGMPYVERAEVVQAIADAGLTVKAGIGALYEEYNEIYNHAKIAIVKSVMGDLTNRFFEGMAQGCCVLADVPKDAEKLGFIAGEHYWPFHDPASAAREAKYLIDTGKWREIAENGHRKVLSEKHTWDSRAQQLLDVVFGKETSQ